MEAHRKNAAEVAGLKAEVAGLKERVATLERAQELILQEVDKRVHALREHVKRFFPE